MKCNYVQELKQRSNNKTKIEKLFNWGGGGSGEHAFLLASKMCQRNQQPFPLCLCLSLPKNVSVTLEHWGWVEGPCTQRIVHCTRKKGLQWLVDLEKTLQPLLASSLLIWKFSFPVPSSWNYRISYLSTRKVVSVENLTGLFPSTWVTLVTCMLQ